MFDRGREHEQVSALRAEVGSLQSRLAADVANLSDAGDPACRQALVDAAERNLSAGGLMSTARTAAELVVARRTVIEGLTAARFVRQKQGLPLGPDLPRDAEVSTPTPVNIGGFRHVVHPDYHPQRPHWFGGSAQAPAGYYRTPFWKKALALGGAVLGAEMLGDAVGDLMGGGMRGFGGDDDGGDYDGGGGGADWGGGGDW